MLLFLYIIYIYCHTVWAKLNDVTADPEAGSLALLGFAWLLALRVVYYPDKSTIFFHVVLSL